MEFKRENLEKLGKYLAKLSVEHNKQHFRMSCFLYHRPDDGAPAPDQEEQVRRYMRECFCGTIACAIGHTPLAMPKEFKQAIKDDPFNSFSWWHISEPLLGVQAHSKLWSWLFDGEWAEESGKSGNPYWKSSWAAADRIAYLLRGHWDEEDEIFTQMMEAIGSAAEMGWITDKLHTYHLNQSGRVFGV